MMDRPNDRLEAGAPRDSDVERSGVKKPTLAQLETENAHLRARVAELEASSERWSSKYGPASVRGRPVGDVSYQQLLTLINNAPNHIYVKDRNHRFVLVNKQFSIASQRSAGEFLGLTERDIFPPETAAALLAVEAEIIASGVPVETEEELLTEEGPLWLHSNKFPIYDAEGVCLGIGAFITNITERKRLEAERMALKEQMIEAQQAALRELSTPLLPLTEGVLAMPLIGLIDSVRASEILETLLQGIRSQRAHTAILDITGVREVDVQTASALVNAARAARLLGARVILTGVSPAVARTLVTLNESLDGIAVLATLASGIAHALRR
jgi:PAS domain S-box-containing protein